MAEHKYSIRLSQQAKTKLESIALKKKSTQGVVASNIILHYAQNDYDCEISIPKSLNSISKTLENHSILLNVVAGRTGRSEDFIKGLLREDRLLLSPNPDPNVLYADDDEDSSPEPQNDQRLPEALSIIEQLISSANEIMGVDGRPVMQIRLQLEKFNHLKAQYKKLCM